GLIAYGEMARDAVAAALDADDTRAPMSLALLRNGEASFPTLRGVIHGGSVASRHAALAIVRRTMAAVVSDDLIIAVVGCLRHEDASVRADAAHTLEGLGPRAKGKDLETAAADPDPAVRAAAVRALGALGVKAGNHDDKDPFVRVEAMLAGWRTGGSGAEELTKIAFDAATEPRVRAAAVTALGDMGLPAASIDLTPLVADQPVEVRRAAAEALGKITWPSAFAIRDARAAADLNPAVEGGLAWLAGAQGTDGEWERGKLTAGTTGLALMAFLAAGRGPSDERHGLAVRRGLAYLTSRQDKRGILSSRESHEFVVCHGIATVALIEGWILGGGDGCRRAAQPALHFIAFARNPGLAWRYEPRGGENDTHVTAWMVMALKLGDAAGLRVDAEAYAGAALWLEKMTDPELGRIGYNYPGGNSARPEDLNVKFPAEFVESMTAAGLWCRQLLGVAPLRGPLEGKGINLLLARPPSQELNSRDFIYWHFGALALFQYGDAPYSKWEKPLSAALAESWDPNGSWKPEDVWSAEGGPVYTTSMAILTLLTRTRYPRDFLTRPKLSPATRAAITALKKACADEDPQVREIATAACARLGG
ncbi:MAG: HEAT repeat domain-containing protein, partial [Planctomycetota bacterium]